MTKFDNTDLDIERYHRRGVIHRDYIAHCFRWSFFVRYTHTRDPSVRVPDVDGCLRGIHKGWLTDVLDVGCGQDLMLYRALVSNKVLPRSYTGVDINKLSRLDEFSGSSLQPRLFGETDVLSFSTRRIYPHNFVACLEMLEHVPAGYAKKVVKHLFDGSCPDVTFIVSTPCYNHKAVAANHINEMTRDAFGWMLEEAGWQIEVNYGTFASKTDIMPYLSEDQKQTYKRLMGYYDTNTLSTFYAPLYPEAARNNLWVLRKDIPDYTRKFTDPGKEPWASGDDWRDLIN